MTTEPSHASVTPTTPTHLTHDLLDRWEKLLNRANEQHERQMAAGRSLLRESLLTRARLAGTDQQRQDEDRRVAVLDAAARLISPMVVSVVDAIEDSDEASEGTVAREFIRELWLLTAAVGDLYARTGKLDVSDEGDLVGTPTRAELIDIVEDAWTVIANANWMHQSAEWTDAAERFRGRWHAVLDRVSPDRDGSAGPGLNEEGAGEAGQTRPSEPSGMVAGDSRDDEQSGRQEQQHEGEHAEGVPAGSDRHA